MKFRKFWKYSKSRQEVTIQDGFFFQTSQISKLKFKYGWIKFRKSKSNLSLDWLWYFQSFLENIIEQTIVHSWVYTRIWEENLNSNQIPCANVQIFTQTQILCANVQIQTQIQSSSICKSCTIYNSRWLKEVTLWHMKTFDHVRGNLYEMKFLWKARLGPKFQNWVPMQCFSYCCEYKKIFKLQFLFSCFEILSLTFPRETRTIP